MSLHLEIQTHSSRTKAVIPHFKTDEIVSNFEQFCFPFKRACEGLCDRVIIRIKCFMSFALHFPRCFKLLVPLLLSALDAFR